MQVERDLLLSFVIPAVVISISQFIPNAYARTLSSPMTTIVHVEDPSLCFNNAAAPIKELSAMYPSGNRIFPSDQVRHGTQLIIEALLSGHCYRSQDENGYYQFTALIEVRNAEGYTEYLTIQKGEIEPWTEMPFAISWTPEAPGEYEIRAFSLGDLNSTSVLSHVVTIRITVV